MDKNTITNIIQEGLDEILSSDTTKCVIKPLDVTDDGDLISMEFWWESREEDDNNNETDIYSRFEDGILYWITINVCINNSTEMAISPYPEWDAERIAEELEPEYFNF